MSVLRRIRLRFVWLHISPKQVFPVMLDIAWHFVTEQNRCFGFCWWWTVAFTFFFLALKKKAFSLHSLIIKISLFTHVMRLIWEFFSPSKLCNYADFVGNSCKQPSATGLIYRLEHLICMKTKHLFALPVLWAITITFFKYFSKTGRDILSYTRLINSPVICLPSFLLFFLLFGWCQLLIIRGEHIEAN